MNNSELNFITVLLKIAKGLFTDVNKTTEVIPVQAVSPGHYAGGILPNTCRLDGVAPEPGTMVITEVHIRSMRENGSFYCHLFF